MTTIGFDSTIQTTIHRLTLAILQIGNVQFREENNVAAPVSDDCEYSTQYILLLEKVKISSHHFIPTRAYVCINYQRQKENSLRSSCCLGK